jgi:hypothetical protein
MTMDVDIGDARPARSPNDSAALAYRAASGAVDRPAGPPRCRAQSRRRQAGRALALAAVDHRQTLTPHDVTIERAGNAATKLDRYMESLRDSGVLAEFNRQYKRRRIEAAARLHDLQNCDIEVEAGAAEFAFQNYSASLNGGSPSTLPITKPRGIPLISHPPDRACILDCRFRRPCLLDAWDLCRSVR